jgi:hypothetical protein
MIKGFVIDKERLENGPKFGQNVYILKKYIQSLGLKIEIYESECPLR